MNKYKPHVLIVPEDDANRQLAIGFRLHHAIDVRAVQVMQPAGGWNHALSELKNAYAVYLRTYPHAHVVLLIDFDDVANRRTVCEQAVPADLAVRVFFIGARREPETVKRDLHRSFETIGTNLAEECYQGQYDLWTGSHFGHNDAERERLSAAVKSILFSGDD